MRYLYGDATESPIDRNYIDLLRDILEFSAAVLTSCDLVIKYEKRAMARERTAASDLQQLDLVAQRLVTAIESCKTMDATLLTQQCIESIRTACTNELKRAENAVKGSLVDEVKNIKKAIVRERADNLKRLESFLVKQDVPSSVQSVDMIASGHHYMAYLSAKSTVGLNYILDLEIPPDHLFGEVTRIERVVPELAIKVPEKAGWVRKSVKLRAHKLGREFLTELSHAGGRTQFKLRDTPNDADGGFDVVVVASAKKVAVTRVSKGAVHEPFEPLPEDIDQLLALHDQLRGALSDLEKSRRGVREAKLDGTPLAEHPDPRVLVDRLVEHMAPVIREISRHSLSPEELVLKRVLADDRREEIFCSKADLRDRIAGLPPVMRAAFAALELGGESIPVIEPPEEPETRVPLPREPMPMPRFDLPSEEIEAPEPMDEDSDATGMMERAQPSNPSSDSPAPESQKQTSVRDRPEVPSFFTPKPKATLHGIPAPPRVASSLNSDLPSPFAPSPSAAPPAPESPPPPPPRIVMPSPKPKFVPRSTPPAGAPIVGPPSTGAPTSTVPLPRPPPPRRGTGAPPPDDTVEVKMDDFEE